MNFMQKAILAGILSRVNMAPGRLRALSYRLAKAADQVEAASTGAEVQSGKDAVKLAIVDWIMMQ